VEGISADIQDAQDDQDGFYYGKINRHGDTVIFNFNKYKKNILLYY